MKKVLDILFYAFIGFIFLGIIFYLSPFYIKLNGDKEISLELFSVYKEEGARTIFNQKIETSDTVDTGIVGEQIVKYCHIKSCIERKVKIIDKDKPVIELNGSSEQNIILNGKYVEKGAVAIDNYDGDITDKIEVISHLDLTKAGKYKIIYKIEDSSNNLSLAYRIINVIENGPLSLSLKEFNLNGYFADTILKQTEDAGWDYVLDTIFYGDSITENMGWYLHDLPESNVWAIHNLTPDNATSWKVPFNKYNEEITLVDGMAKYKPKRIIIQLGANSVGPNTIEHFISSYENLITKAKEASPESIIIVESVFPVGAKYDTGYNLNNTKINNINYYLAEMCDRIGVYFLNTAEALKDENGQMNLNYCYKSDNIHLLSSGNQVLLNYVRTHAVFNTK